jgi:hypothetical protein
MPPHPDVNPADPCSQQCVLRMALRLLYRWVESTEDVARYSLHCSPVHWPMVVVPRCLNAINITSDCEGYV